MLNIPKISRMIRHTFPALFLFSALGFTQIAAPTSNATTQPVITDPQQITSKSKLDVQPLTVEKLYMTRVVSDSTWSPDGKQIAFITNISGRRNIWTVSSESGWPVQLTVSNQREANPTWSPKGRWIAYASDYDGNEQFDLFLVSSSNGQVINLTNSPEISEESPTWSPDGEKLAYTTKPKEAASYEIDVMETLSKKVTHITSNTPKNLSNSGPIWSRDGKWIVYTQSNATLTDGNIFIANAATGKATNLTPHQGEQTFTATDLSPDGKTVLLTSNSGNGYENAALLDVATKKIRWLTADKWEVQTWKFSPDGKHATWATDEDGNGVIVLYDLGSNKAEKLPVGNGVNFLAGSESAFSPDGSRLMYNHDGPVAPSGLWTYDLATKKARQITFGFAGGIRSEDMVEPFLVHYPSKDGKWQISALVYVPYNAERNGKNAAVVYVHGGPNAQVQNFFNRHIQYLANQGYFVIAPNYRGSSGYGKEFENANHFDMGGGDLEDVISAADWLVKTGYVDTKKIAVDGGSYGGYLAMMAVTKAPERWAAGIPWIPFVNWFTAIENTDPGIREYAIASMGDPMKETARYKERSPINFVDRIKAPLLLLAGGKDPRCPPTEAEQVVQAVKKRGGVVEYKVYENEGHGFTKLENQIDSLNRIGEFLKKYDPPEKCGCNIYP